ncbi:mucin-2-like isoform X11 [Neocloeon triangulifer]|uniref:mucin-2-like isoform X11 n=1 Tax=Neocloeon triangulifer TaxID=2078957 RepID=UPI00286F26D3|nr:mucin-2-like isoform X11 [Neocloeon triangulifer]
MRCVILVAVLVCVQSAIGQLYYWAHSPALEPHYAYGDVITSWDPGVQQTQRLPRLAISDDTEFAASSSDFVNKSPSTDSSSRRKARQRYNGVNQGLAKRAEAPQDAAADGLAAVESEKAAPPKRPRSRTAGRAESPTQQPAQQDAESTTAKNGRGRGGFRGKATFTTPDIPERNRGRSLRGPQNIESPAAVGSTEGTSVIKRRPVNVRRKPYGGDTQRKPFPSNSEADGEKSSTSEKPSTEKPIKRPFLPPEEVSLKEQHQKPPTDVRPVTYKPPLPPNKPSNSSKPAPKPTTFKPSFVPKDLLVSETTTAAAHPSPKFTHVKSVTIISTSPEQVSIKPHRTSVVRTTAKPLHKATTVVKAISPKGEHKKAIIVSIGTTPLPTLNSTTAQQIRTSPRLSIKNSVLDLSPPASSSKFGLSSTPYNPYSSIKVTSTPAASSKTPTTVSVTPPSTTTSTTTDRLFPAHVSSPSNDLQPPNEQKTTAARRRKPSGEANKNSTPRPRNSDEDISESDNYPDEFKQKIKSGGKKEKETPFIVTPSKTYPLKSSTTTTTKAPATTTTTTTAQPKTLPPVDKLIEEDNQLTTKVRRPSRPSATTPFPRRRSPTLAPRVPSEGKDDAAIKSRAELLKKGNRRPPLQSASLINEGIREAKEEIVSTAAPRVYSRPNRPVAAIAPEQQEDTPLTPLVQKFSSKYRGDLKGIVSNAPVYVPTVPPLTVSLSPATAPVAEALTSTTKKEESLLEFGSNFDFPTTPLSTDAPTSSTTESFRWKPLETTETTSEKVEVVTAETVGPTEDLLFDLINAQKSTTSSTTTTTTTTTTTSTTTTTTPRAPISTTEFEGLDLASLFKSTTKTNIRPTVSSIETSNSGRKVPNNVVPIINENNHVEQPTRRPSRTRQTTEPTTTTTTTSTSTTTTTEAPSTKKTKVWVVPKDAGESTSASNNEETSNKAAIPGFGGITANDLLLLELLSKRGGQTPEETKPANSKTADKPKIDFAGLNLAKLLAAGENGDATELDASLFPAPPSTTTRRPRVVPTNPPAPAYAAPAYEAPAQAVGSGAWNAVQGSGSTLFQLLRVIGGASIGPSNSAGQAPVAEPDEVYLEPATTASTRTRGRQQNKPTATNGRRPGYRTTTLSPYFAEELPDSFDAPQAPPQSALVTVAINVTKTVASLMARVLSGAARTFGAAVRGASTAIQEQWQQPSS